MQIDLTIDEVRLIVNGELIGDGSQRMYSINKIENASDGQLTFLASAKYVKYLQHSTASCILVAPEISLPADTKCAFIIVEDPHRSLVKLINHIVNSKSTRMGIIHPTASISTSARIGEFVCIGPNVVIDDKCVVGDNVTMLAGSVLQSGVQIGTNTVIYPNVTVYADCIVGKRCIIHAGAVIGSDGFGYLENKDGSFEKIPQVGNVVIDDDVEIGANACIDRAALGSTTIKQGVKIDNLVHIAHNAEIGCNTAIAALSGIAGGAVIGFNNRVAGQVGIVGYVNTTDNVIIGAQSGVSKNITKSGVYSGSPAVELSVRLKQEALLRQLPKLLDDLRNK